MSDLPTCPTCHRPLSLDDMKFLLGTITQRDMSGIEGVTRLRDTLGMDMGDQLPDIIARAVLVVETLRGRIRVLEGRRA